MTDTAATEEYVGHNDFVNGYEEIVVTTKEQKKLGRRRYFPSNVQDSFIVNAETGVKYTFRVGSNDSRCLFKMVDTTGVCDKNGFEINPRDASYPNRNPNHIYYDSPEQFMRHQRTTLDPELIAGFKRRQGELA
jgi:hypothetical protein